MISSNLKARFLTPYLELPSYLNWAKQGAINWPPTIMIPWMWLGMTTKESNDITEKRPDNPIQDACAIRPGAFGIFLPSEISPKKQIRCCVTTVTKYAPHWA